MRYLHYQVFATCVMSIAIHVNSAWAQYQVSIFAQPGDVFHGYTIAEISHEESLFSMNDHGEIAFMSTVVADPRSGALMTADRFIAGAGRTVDGTVPMIWDEDYDVWINNLGQVAYGAPTVGGGYGVFLDDQLIFTQGALDGEPIYAARVDPILDDHQSLTFEVRFDEPSQGNAWIRDG